MAKQIEATAAQHEEDATAVKDRGGALRYYAEHRFAAEALRAQATLARATAAAYLGASDEDLQS